MTRRAFRATGGSTDIEAAIERFAIRRDEILALVAHGHIKASRAADRGLLLPQAQVTAWAERFSKGLREFDVVECCLNESVTPKRLAAIAGWELCELVHVARYFGAIAIGQPDLTRINILDGGIACLDYRDLQLRRGFKLTRHDAGARTNTRATSVPCTCGGPKDRP
jgi:hypothetical protein